MSIEKVKVVDQITVTENGIILYREATKIIEDGVELTKTYHRSSLTPGQDLTGVPANVVAIANTVWTAECIAAYQAQLEANRL
jgi:predicted ThiF/HesA family dinucleotide-utilizing enzyme